MHGVCPLSEIHPGQELEALFVKKKKKMMLSRTIMEVFNKWSGMSESWTKYPTW